jgi:hypothetical protein
MSRMLLWVTTGRNLTQGYESLKSEEARCLILERQKKKEKKKKPITTTTMMMSRNFRKSLIVIWFPRSDLIAYGGV